MADIFVVIVRYCSFVLEQISSTATNLSKAKQLVEKAKTLRHNRSRTSEDSPAPVRRSSRQQALAEKKKSQENEVSLYLNLKNILFW